MRREPRQPAQFAHQVAGVPPDPRQPGADVVAKPVDGVHRPRRPDRSDRQASQPRELDRHQPLDEPGVDADLPVMHPHAGGCPYLSPPVTPAAGVWPGWKPGMAPGGDATAFSAGRPDRKPVLTSASVSPAAVTALIAAASARGHPDEEPSGRLVLAQKARCGSGSPPPTGPVGSASGWPRRACPATSRANPRTPTRPTMVRGDMNSRTGTTPASMAMNRSASGWLRDSASNRAVSPGLGGLSAASRAVKSYIGRAERSRAR